MSLRYPYDSAAAESREELAGTALHRGAVREPAAHQCYLVRENEGRECRRRSDQSLSARLSVPGVLLVRGRSALRVGAGFAAQPALVTLARAVPVTAGEKVLGGSFRKMGARVSSRIRVVPPRCYTARGLKREKHRGGGGWLVFIFEEWPSRGDSLAGGGDGRKAERPVERSVGLW